MRGYIFHLAGEFIHSLFIADPIPEGSGHAVGKQAKMAGTPYRLLHDCDAVSFFDLTDNGRRP